jgi:hypothetical protein
VPLSLTERSGIFVQTKNTQEKERTTAHNTKKGEINRNSGERQREKKETYQ